MHVFVLILVSSIFIGFIGRNGKLGFWGYLFASLLLTPLVGLLLVLVSDLRPARKPRGGR